MDYFKGTVETYLRSDRTLFLNSEYCLQLDGDIKYPVKNRYWYVDILAVDFRHRSIWLCELTFSKTFSALMKRLTAWSKHWPDIEIALKRDSSIPAEIKLPARPWVFLPAESEAAFKAKIQTVITQTKTFMPMPRITILESTVPWKYSSWNSRHDYEV